MITVLNELEQSQLVIEICMAFHKIVRDVL